MENTTKYTVTIVGIDQSEIIKIKFLYSTSS